MTVPMKALKIFRFPAYGPKRNVGDVFEVPGTMRAGSVPHTLQAVGLAERVIASPVPPVRPPAAGAYSTRMMTAAPSLPPVPMSLSAQYVIKVDGANVALDDMEAEPLHELAKRLGVKVHHLAGARKVRAALVASQQA